MRSATTGRTRRSPWLRLALFSLTLCLFTAGYYWGNHYQRTATPELQAGVLLRPPLDLPPFQASRPSGAPLTRAEFNDRWHLLALGAGDGAADDQTLGLMTRILNRLAGRPKVQAVLSPALLLALPDNEQTKQRLQRAVRYHPDLQLGYSPTGGLDQVLAKLASASSHGLYLLDRQLRIHAMFTLDGDPANIARDIAAIIDAHP